METRPRLTVVIPTYNRSELLGRTLRGLLEQSAPASEYEIVVVDDGSTDTTQEVLAKVAAPEERLRHCRQENKGPAAARNLGVSHARGEIILFTGDDCLPDNRLVEEHLRAHELSGDIGVLGLVTWHPEINITPFMAYLETGPQFGFSQITDPENVSIWHWYTSNCSVRKRRLEEIGGFDEEFRYAAYEDMELAYRMVKQGLRISYRRTARTYHHHPTTFQQHLARQRVTGLSAVLLARKHPELTAELGLAHAAQKTTALKFWEAATEYAFALGVREGLTGKPAPEWDQLDALTSDPARLEAERAWLRDLFGEMDASTQELITMRAELHRLQQEFERVTSRRLYRWTEALARGGWGVLRRLGLARGPGGN